MNNDPISQLPEPDRAAWDVLHEAGDLENILKNILKNAKTLVNADWGMIVLKSDSSPYNYFLPYVRTLPDMRQETFEEKKIPLLVYLLARQTMTSNKNRLIPDTSNISLQEQQEMAGKFLGDWKVKPAIESNKENDIPQSLLIIPIIATNDVIGSITLGRPIDEHPFTFNASLEVERFISHVSGYLTTIVRASDLLSKEKHMLSYIIYETHPHLVSIKGYAELLLSETTFGKLSHEQNVFVKGIQNSHKIFKQVIDTFFYLSKLETGDIHTENGRYDIGEIITERYKRLRTNFEDKKQQVNMNFTKDIFVWGDRVMIEYVIEAYMKNASLYSLKQGNVEISVTNNADFVRVSVADHGIGLTDEQKSHLFQQFYRSDRAEVREHFGIGLELFISKQYVEKMGGQVGAEGSLNQGSTFWFSLPINNKSRNNERA